MYYIFFIKKNFNFSIIFSFIAKKIYLLLYISIFIKKKLSIETKFVKHTTYIYINL